MSVFKHSISETFIAQLKEAAKGGWWADVLAGPEAHCRPTWKLFKRLLARPVLVQGMGRIAGAYGHDA